jgi:hypothetical protein
MALLQMTYFSDQAILATDEDLLDQTNRNHTDAPPGSPNNQRDFTNFTVFPPPNIPGVPKASAGKVHAVFFDGNYHNLTTKEDLDLYYSIHCILYKITFTELPLLTATQLTIIPVMDLAQVLWTSLLLIPRSSPQTSSVLPTSAE